MIRILTCCFILIGWWARSEVHGQEIQTIQLQVSFPVLSAENLKPLLKKYGIRTGEMPVNRVPALMDSLVRLYEDQGHPFAAANLDTISWDGTRIHARVRIDPGPVVTYDSVVNRTGYRLQHRQWYRITGIRPGDPYSESKLKLATRNLTRIVWLEQKRPPEVEFHDRSASMFIYPSRSAANRFDGWVGLSPNPAGTGTLRFAGAMDLSVHNLLAQGEQWVFKWNRTQDRSQQLRLGLSLPWLAGLPFGFEGGLDMYRQDTSYLNLNLNAGVPWSFSTDHRLSLFYRSRESILLTDSKASTPGRQAFKTSLTGLSWYFNTLDNRLSPNKGFEVVAEGSYGRKTVADSASMGQTEFAANLAYYATLVRNLVVRAGVTGGLILSDQLLENEVFRLGGVSDLVGFEEDQFQASRFATGSIELRYLLDPASFLLLKADAGVLHPFGADPVNLTVPYGFGLGGQVRTSGGIFRILFGLGIEPGTPFNIRNGKIHIGYVGMF